MNNFKHILFLINPVSGSAKSNCIEILEQIKPKDYHFEYLVWKEANEKDQLIRDINLSEAEVLVAVGGDGTINFLAELVLRKDKVLGIIPSGSGNGLARHLKIPLDKKKAIKRLLISEVKQIDVASVNGNYFLCTAGVGFDALIGKEFAKRDSTGFWGYVKKVINRVFNYTPEIYRLKFGHSVIEKEAYMITFANASQYGNNAFIAPQASVKDGKLNICIMKPFPLIMALPIAFRLFTKSLDKSKYLETLTLSEISIDRNPGPVHLDGDPYEMNGSLNIKILPKKIKVIY
ncbi:diacylglycerol kinase family lipid kinase [Hyphobacterium sp. CCMP332]|nr:diacylglycerol kinase family lipid kinase [Hyphobacterium sp. CCMP332]